MTGEKREPIATPSVCSQNWQPKEKYVEFEGMPKYGQSVFTKVLAEEVRDCTIGMWVNRGTAS
jgi:hypothetical protein